MRKNCEVEGIYSMELHALKSVNNCLNTNIYYYSETSGGQRSNLYLNVVHFSRPVLIRHLWQLKTAAFLHWCLIYYAVLSIPSCQKVGEIQV